MTMFSSLGSAIQQHQVRGRRLHYTLPVHGNLVLDSHRTDAAAREHQGQQHPLVYLTAIPPIRKTDARTRRSNQQHPGLQERQIMELQQTRRGTCFPADRAFVHKNGIHAPEGPTRGLRTTADSSTASLPSTLLTPSHGHPKPTRPVPDGAIHRSHVRSRAWSQRPQ